MNFLPFLKKKREKNFFLTLLLKPLKVGALLFEEEGTLHLLATREETVTLHVNHISDTELLNVFDSILSDLDKNLPEGTLVKKTIFAVPYEWVEEAKIKKGYLLKLKKLCDELELTPIGFIIYIEAVIHFLQKKEGAPVSGVFVEIIGEHLIVYVVKAGKIFEMKSQTIMGSFSSTVESILRQLSTIEVLPSKIILLDYEGIESIQQEFLSHHWPSNLHFLHVPQVAVLEKGIENEAVINGVATQMGFDVLDKENVNTEKEEKDLIKTHENFGFLQDEDVMLQQEDTPEQVPINPHHRENQFPAPIKQSSLQDITRFLTVPSFLKPPHIQLKIPSISVPRILPSFSFSGTFLLFVVGIIAFCVGFYFFYYHYVLRTELILFLDKKVIDNTVSVNLSTDKPTSVKDAVLKSNRVESEIEAQLSKNTTGKKDTGEKARGEIIVYNKIEQKKTFSKGTVLVSTNDLAFELDEDVTIASTSAFSTTLSSVKAQAIASKFGPEYNVSSGTNFVFKEYPASSYFAKSESAFSGGTKKEVTVVSKNDLDTLTSDIITQQKDKALEKLKEQLLEADVLIPFILSQEFVEKKFDKKEEEEAQKVTMNAKMKFVGVSYNKSEIDRFVSELTHEVPSQYGLDANNSTSELKDLTLQKNGNITGVIVAHSVYIPSINLASLKSNLEGKNPRDITKKLKAVKGVSEYKIRYKNKVPFLPEVLPFEPSHIVVKTKFDE